MSANAVPFPVLDVALTVMVVGLKVELIYKFMYPVLHIVADVDWISIISLSLQVPATVLQRGYTVHREQSESRMQALQAV